MKRLVLLSLGLIALVTACQYPSDNDATKHSPLAKPTITPQTEASKDAGPVPTDINAESSDLQSVYVNPMGSDLFSIIPDGWHVLEREDEPARAEGDLNKDGIPDIAVVIEKTEASEEAPPRSLLIAFGNENHTYTLSIIADTVVLAADTGGVWGDPFDRLLIDRGSVVVRDYGGSNWRWYDKYRFRFQDNDWYLIGATMGSYFTGDSTPDEGDEDDYNFLTGDYILRRKDDNGNINTIKGNRGTSTLMKLSEFDSDVIRDITQSIENSSNNAVELVAKQMKAEYNQETDDYSLQGETDHALIFPIGFVQSGEYEVRVCPSYYPLSVFHYFYVDLQKGTVREE